MSGTNCYIFQQHYDILRELKQQNIRTFKICVGSSSSSNRSSSNINSSVCNCSSNVNVAVTVETSSGLNLSYEIRFFGLAQDITNTFRSI